MTTYRRGLAVMALSAGSTALVFVLLFGGVLGALSAIEPPSADGSVVAQLLFVAGAALVSTWEHGVLLFLWTAWVWAPMARGSGRFE